MDARQQGLARWARKITRTDGQWTAVAGDASSRRYFRLQGPGGSHICVDAPPATERNQAFLEVRSLLADAGLPVPRLTGADLESGFLLLEDLGDTLLLDRLDAETVDSWYQLAMDLLLSLQGIAVEESGLPDYGAAVLAEELSRFAEWFCSGLLDLELDESSLALLASVEQRLIDSALAQPVVVVHRDFHSRNLLVSGNDSLAMIDFQDALAGPLCYDLVSLLRDCYVCWPAARVNDWLADYRARLLAAGRPAGESAAEFRRWFDWMGLQRHLKVLGNFARLALRDDKPGYLRDLPLVLHYIRQVLEAYPELDDFFAWFSDRVEPAIRRQPWSVDA